MKSVAADSMTLGEVRRKRVESRAAWDGSVKYGVEDRDRQSFETRSGANGLNHFQSRDVVKRGKVFQLLDLTYHAAGNSNRSIEAIGTMHDAKTDPADISQIADALSLGITAIDPI